MAVDLPDSSKTKLAKQIGAVKKAGSKLQRILLCQLDGFGRFDVSAYHEAVEELETQFEEAQAIYAGHVEPTGLLREA